MKRHLATIQSVHTPLLDNDNDDYDDFDNYIFENSNDSLRIIKQRMVLIMVVVPIIAGILAFLALPASSEAKTINQKNTAVSPQNVSQDVEQNIAQTTTVQAGSTNGSIASFFTPEVQYWGPKIIEWAQLHAVDPNAVATIMQIESCGDPEAVSGAGARGLFQVMPFHFTDGEDMLDPDTNATRGLNFFNEQLRYTGGDVFLSFAGYNGGYAASGGAYENWANETQRYYQWARGIYEDAASGADSSETLDTWLAAGGAAGCQRAAGRLNLN